MGPLNVAKIDNILWQVERTVTKVFLPFLNSALITNTVEKSMKSKIRKSIIEIQKMYFLIKKMASFCGSMLFYLLEFVESLRSCLG